MAGIDLRGADPLFAAMDLLSGPVFALDQTPEGHFVVAYLNRYFSRTTGRRLALVGARLDRVFPPRTARSLEEGYRNCLENGADLCFDELLGIFGDARWWRTTLTAADPPAGMRARVVGIAVDITDMKAREEATAIEIAQLREQHNELHTLAALTAHDLRTPLANVAALSELVLDGFHDMGDGKRDMIRACGEVAETSLGTISQIMERIARPLPEVQTHSAIDLGKVCRQLSAVADPAGAFAIAYPEESVESDETIVLIALRNLLDNAARFAQGRIEIGLEAEGERIALTVADDGPGFLPGLDPVARAAARGGATGGARGFGLGAVIRLLRSRGGEIAPVATPLGGAALRVVLPGRILSPAARDLPQRRSA